MTTTSSTPDIASLTISGPPPSGVAQQQQIEYEGRPQYHFQTSTGVPASAYMSPSPLKNKTSRAGLPTVFLLPVSLCPLG